MATDTPAGRERAALCDLFETLGPDAPTLCEGWATRELAAHLYMRERRPHAALGLVVPALSGVTDRATEKVARIDYPTVVTRLRSGPPLPARALDNVVNLHEYFVHHEDVRRAQPSWERRHDPGLDDALWKLLRRSARILTRRIRGVGLSLSRTDGDRASERIMVRSGSATATIQGSPQEIVLYVFGRRDVADVTVEGPDEARSIVEGADLEV